jgi:hypothetical protein
MADSVDTNVIFNGTNKYIVRLTNVSDGTGESGVIKVDKSALIGPTGVAPGRIAVLSIQWAIQGFSSVKLLWDHTTDDEIAVLSSAGFFDYTQGGGLLDPNSAGDTGDILLTTVGATSTATYDITLTLKLKS